MQAPLEVNEPGFRFDHKALFLTYSQCGELTRDDLFVLLSSFEPNFLVIGQELHADGGRHFHAVIGFTERFRSRNARAFDWLGIHPNIRSVWSMPGAITYCKKDGDFVEWGNVPQEKKRSWSTLIEDSKSPSDFMANSRTAFPREFVLHNDKFESFANKYYNRPEEYVPRLDPFNIPSALDDWVEQVLNQVCLNDTS